MNRLLFLFVFFPFLATAQTVSQKLQTAFQHFEKDPQLASAISSLYVIDAKTGKVIFDKNSRIGLAPASTQKIITSVTAFELLGKHFRYETKLSTVGDVNNGTLSGNLYFIGSGDPTFGSSRYISTKSERLLRKILLAVQKAGIQKIDGTIGFNYRTFSNLNIPGGWLWEDIGNYYGAGAYILNWKENQFDVVLSSNKEKFTVPHSDHDVELVSPSIQMINELKAGPKGSGDQAVCYIPGYGNAWFINGSIPVNENRFTVSASDTNPPLSFLNDLNTLLTKNSIATNGIENYFSQLTKPFTSRIDGRTHTTIFTHQSPPLDSIIYWFNKKSINLYGEALVKTMGLTKKASGLTDSGVAVIKQFWKTKGIAEHELNIFDGSGLSPMNRVTTHAQVDILKYAKGKDWFPLFYNSLPLHNGMVMKGGTINSTKGFCGYHTAKNGNSYIFSFLVNNYNGGSAELVGKMYKVLDILK